MTTTVNLCDLSTWDSRSFYDRDQKVSQAFQRNTTETVAKSVQNISEWINASLDLPTNMTDEKFMPENCKQMQHLECDGEEILYRGSSPELKSKLRDVFSCDDKNFKDMSWPFYVIMGVISLSMIYTCVLLLKKWFFCCKELAKTEPSRDTIRNQIAGDYEKKIKEIQKEHYAQVVTLKSQIFNLKIRVVDLKGQQRSDTQDKERIDTLERQLSEEKAHVQLLKHENYALVIASQSYLKYLDQARNSGSKGVEPPPGPPTKPRPKTQKQAQNSGFKGGVTPTRQPAEDRTKKQNQARKAGAKVCEPLPGQPADDRPTRKLSH